MEAHYQAAVNEQDPGVVETCSDDITTEGNRVAVRAAWRGSHRSEFLDIEPTGRPITFAAECEPRHRPR